MPKFNELDEFLGDRTGFKIHVVPGLIPVEEFFELLEKRRFSASTWLRKKSQLDYLEEPDMFHDVFGHVPLLSDSKFADFMQAFGAAGMRVIKKPHDVVKLQRLYWFTIEFGLIRENNHRLVYGAGIASSYGETNHCLGDAIEVRPFDLEQIMSHEFFNDRIQEVYYELANFEELFNAFEDYVK